MLRGIHSAVIDGRFSGNWFPCNISSQKCNTTPKFSRAVLGLKFYRLDAAFSSPFQHFGSIVFRCDFWLLTCNTKILSRSSMIEISLTGFIIFFIISIFRKHSFQVWLLHFKYWIVYEVNIDFLVIFYCSLWVERMTSWVGCCTALDWEVIERFIMAIQKSYRENNV